MISAKAKTVGVSKARTQFASLLKQVAKGKEVIITNRGRPVARLRPMEMQNPNAKKDVYDRIREFHGRIILPKGETVKDLINAGRRI